MLEKLHATHGTKTIYLQPKSSQSFQFGIQHFAGAVSYNPVGMYVCDCYSSLFLAWTA